MANGARTESVALGPRERGTVLTAPPLMSNMGEPFDPGISNPVEGALLNSVVKKDIVPSMSEGVTGIKEAYACLFVCVSANFF